MVTLPLVIRRMLKPTWNSIFRPFRKRGVLYRGNHVLWILSAGDDIDEGGLARVLQTDQSQLHLLLPEQGPEPVQHSIDHRQHPDRALKMSKLAIQVWRRKLSSNYGVCLFLLLENCATWQKVTSSSFNFQIKWEIDKKKRGYLSAKRRMDNY